MPLSGEIRNLLAVLEENYQAIDKVKEKGVTIHRWSKDELDRARAIAMEVWDDYAKKNSRSKEVIESMKAHMVEIGSLKQ